MFSLPPEKNTTNFISLSHLGFHVRPYSLLIIQTFPSKDTTWTQAMPRKEAENTQDKIRRKRRRWNCAISKQSTKCEMEKRSVGKRKFDLTLANMRVSWKFLPNDLLLRHFPIRNCSLLTAPILCYRFCMHERKESEGGGGKAYKNTQNHILHFLRVVVVSSFPHSCVWQQDGTKAEALNVAMCGCECVSLDFLILNVLWNLLPFSCCLPQPTSSTRVDKLLWLGLARDSLSLF